MVVLDLELGTTGTGDGTTGAGMAGVGIVGDGIAGTTGAGDGTTGLGILGDGITGHGAGILGAMQAFTIHTGDLLTTVTTHIIEEEEHTQIEHLQTDELIFTQEQLIEAVHDTQVHVLLEEVIIVAFDLLIVQEIQEPQEVHVALEVRALHDLLTIHEYDLHDPMVHLDHTIEADHRLQAEEPILLEEEDHQAVAEDHLAAEEEAAEETKIIYIH